MSYRSFLLTVLVVAAGLVILALFFHSRHEPDAQPDAHLPLAQVQGITIVKRDKNGNLCTIIAEAVQLPQHQQDIACKRVTVTLAGEGNDQQAVLQIAEANIDRDGKVVKCYRRVTGSMGPMTFSTTACTYNRATNSVIIPNTTLINTPPAITIAAKSTVDLTTQSVRCEEGVRTEITLLDKQLPQ